MPIIKKSKVVPYTQSEMYHLVNDIEAYSQFIPGCLSSEILHKKEDEVQAALTFAKGGIHKTFSTLNRLQPYKMIEIRLINGPFKQLEGFWHFSQVNDKRCLVRLDLDFEFSTPLLGLMFGPFFNQIAATLVDVFCERAKTLYGPSS